MSTDEDIDTLLSKLSKEEADEKSDSSDMSTLQAFGDPREYRTMSRLPDGMVNRLAAIHARSVHTPSRIRRQLVENLFLMYRSTGGWGSEQMVKVATSRQPQIHMPQKSGFMSGLFGPRQPKE